ncbi:hypothetical protein M885DRAFT_551079 [Pelagophyceae sp. CCMP2097]|nr:hypothetical protein M885DRAFT_551079 [Pelagophyceae sp. CCMP2097]
MPPDLDVLEDAARRPACYAGLLAKPDDVAALLEAHPVVLLWLLKDADRAASLQQRSDALRLLGAALALARARPALRQALEASGFDPDASALSVAAINACNCDGSIEGAPMRASALELVPLTTFRPACPTDVALTRRWCVVAAVVLNDAAMSPVGAPQAARALAHLLECGGAVAAAVVGASLAGQPPRERRAADDWVHWDEAACACVADANANVRSAAIDVLAAARHHLKRSRGLGEALARRVFPRLVERWRLLDRTAVYRGAKAVLDVSYPTPLMRDVAVGNDVLACLDRCDDGGGAGGAAAEGERAFFECWASLHASLRSVDAHWPKWARMHGPVLARPYERAAAGAACLALVSDAARAAPKTEHKAFWRVWSGGIAAGLANHGVDPKVDFDQLLDAVRAINAHVVDDDSSPVEASCDGGEAEPRDALSEGLFVLVAETAIRGRSADDVLCVLEPYRKRADAYPTATN